MTVTTFTLAVDNDDQVVQGTRVGIYPPTYDTTGNASQPSATNQFNTVSYLFRQAVLRFDTSTLPAGAVISAAKLKLNILQISDSDNKSIRGDYHAWAPAPGSGDYDTTPPSATAIADVDITSLSVADTDFTLLTPDASINKTGYTGIRLSLTGGAPTSFNNVVFSGHEDSVTLCARLEVTYTVPPSGTGAATNPSVTAAASGAELPTGSGAVTNPSVTAAATGTQTQTGTVGASNQSTTAAATGTQTQTGTGAATNPSMSVAATGFAWDPDDVDELAGDGEDHGLLLGGQADAGTLAGGGSERGILRVRR